MPTTKKIPPMALSDLTDLPDLLTVDEAAAVWRISDTQVRRLIASGECPAVRISSRCRRIPKSWVLQTLAEGGALKESKQQAQARVKDREALELRKAGATYQQIADKMGISLSGAGLCVSRAMNELRLQVDGKLPSDEV